MADIKGRVVVVDDEEATRTLIARVLQHEGYEVVAVDNGLEALKVVDQTQPDLVVSDVMMPELTGLEFARGLRHHEATRTVPIIFVTASDNPRHLAESIQLKAKHYLSKPFTNEKLLKTVAAAIRAAAK